jgi:hypothetical protein
MFFAAPGIGGLIMLKDEIEALRRMILERQESVRRKRQVRARASASISLGVFLASAIAGGIWFERQRQSEGIKSHGHESQVTDTATIETLPYALQDEVMRISDPSFIDNILLITEDSPLDREDLLFGHEGFEDSGPEFVLKESQDSTVTPDPSNELQQIEPPVEKPKEKGPSTDSYGVQLASVLTEQDAAMEKARLSTRYHNELRNLSIHVETVTLSDFGKRYRIVAGKTDKESATEICRRLKQMDMQCLLTKIENTKDRVYPDFATGNSIVPTGR